MQSSFFPIAFETFGPINQTVRTSFLHWAIEYLLTLTTHEIHFPFQCLSVTIQRFNAVCFANSFGNFEVEVRRNQPRHT